TLRRCRTTRCTRRHTGWTSCSSGTGPCSGGRCTGSSSCPTHGGTPRTSSTIRPGPNRGASRPGQMNLDFGRRGRKDGDSPEDPGVPAGRELLVLHGVLLAGRGRQHVLGAGHGVVLHDAAAAPGGLAAVQAVV